MEKFLVSLTNKLPHIWSSPLATQIVTLATQIALEIGLNQALQNGDSVKLLKVFRKEIISLVSLAVTSLKGKSLVEEDVTRTQPSDSQRHISTNDQDHDTNVTIKQGGVSQNQKHSRSYLVPKSHTAKMETIVTLLTTFQHKLKGLQSVMSSVRNITSSFHWQSMLHYNWSTHDSQASISAMGSSLSYGYHYTGSAMRLVLTPLMERSMCFLLDAVKQGNSSLILGKEVNMLKYFSIMLAISVICPILASNNVLKI